MKPLSSSNPLIVGGGSPEENFEDNLSEINLYLTHLIDVYGLLDIAPKGLTIELSLIREAVIFLQNTTDD